MWSHVSTGRGAQGNRGRGVEGKRGNGTLPLIPVSTLHPNKHKVTAIFRPNFTLLVRTNVCHNKRKSKFETETSNNLWLQLAF